MPVLIEVIANELYVDGKRLAFLASPLQPAYPGDAWQMMRPGIWRDIAASRARPIMACPLDSAEAFSLYWFIVLVRASREAARGRLG